MELLLAAIGGALATGLEVSGGAMAAGVSTATAAGSTGNVALAACVAAGDELEATGISTLGEFIAVGPDAVSSLVLEVCAAEAGDSPAAAVVASIPDTEGLAFAAVDPFAVLP